MKLLDQVRQKLRAGHYAYCTEQAYINGFACSAALELRQEGIVLAGGEGKTAVLASNPAIIAWAKAAISASDSGK